MRLTWRRLDGYSQGSDPAGFKIAAYRVAGVVRYEAWRLKERLGDWATAEQARAAAQLEARRRPV